MPGRVSSPTLVGRDDELATLAAALDAAAAGSPVHHLVAGEAGVGKSRLVAEASAAAGMRGFRVLAGGCADIGDGGVPFGPLVEALRTLARDLEPEQLDAVLGEGRADLSRLLPDLGRAPEPVSTTEFLAPRLLDALLGTLRRLSAQGPVLLVVEDLHWADPATRDAVAYLVRQLRADPILLLLTFRVDELHRRHPLLPWVAELERSGRLTRLPLPRLDAAATGRLLDGLLGTAADATLVDRIHRRSDGNPFFIEELAGAGALGGHGPMPETLRDVLLARIVALPDPAQSVVRIAAVAGRRVDHDLLAAVAAMPEDALIEALRSAVGSHVLVTGAAADTHGGDYAFRHALLAEAAYDDLLPGERARLHRAYAEALAEMPVPIGAAEAGHWAALAFHWDAARDLRRSFEASIRAADASTRTFAFADAQRHGERALDLWAAVTGAEALAGMDRPTLLDRTAQAAWLASDSRRAVALRREAAAALPESDPLRLGIALERLGRALWYHGETAAAVAAHEEALARIPPEPPTPELARVLAGYGQILMLLDHWSEATAVLRRAVDLARATGARQAEGHAANSLGLCLVVGGRTAEGYAALEAALAIAYEIGSPDDIGRAYVNLSDAKRYAGEPAETLEVVRRGVIAAERVGLDRTYAYFIRANGIQAAFELDAWDEADALADASVRQPVDGRVHRRYGLSNWLALVVARDGPDAEAGIAELRALLEGSTEEGQFRDPFWAAEAEHALWAGDPAAALAAVAAGRSMERPDGVSWYETRLRRIGVRAAAELAEVARARRDSEGERAAVDAGRAILDELATTLAAAGERLAPGTLDELRAEHALAVAEGTRLVGSPDPDAWAGSAARWVARGNVYLEAYCGLRLAEAALSSGDRAAAAAALRPAHATASRLDALPLRTEIERLAARARLELASPEQALPSPAVPATPADPFGLTPREREVLPLVAAGRTNRQIAETLFISENTAGVHVSNILGKLGASTRAEAAGIAARLGLG